MSQQITLEEFDNMLKKCIIFYDGINNGSNDLIDIIYRYRLSDDFKLDTRVTNTLKKQYDDIIEYEKLKELLDKCKDFYGTSNTDLNVILGITSIPLLVSYAESIKSIYRDIRKRKIIEPSEKYGQLAVYDFGSNRRNGTQFEINYYSRGATPDNSILLYIFMHGEILLSGGSPILMEDRDVTINKYSTSSPGQCSINSSYAGKYMIYALSGALQNNTPLDVGAMLRESLLPPNLADPQESFRNSLSAKEVAARQFASGNQELRSIRKTNTVELAYDINNPTGEEVTSGYQYIEKGFSLDHIAQDRGIYLCNDWARIGGGAMDNLLGNKEFIMFMLDKYGDSVLDNLTEQKSLNGEPVAIMDSIKMSDIIEFCKVNGKPHISIVDGSCSVLTGNRHIGHRRGTLVANYIRELKGYAKGIVKSRRLPQRKKKKQTKGKGKGKNRKTR